MLLYRGETQWQYYTQRYFPLETLKTDEKQLHDSEFRISWMIGKDFSYLSINVVSHSIGARTGVCARRMRYEYLETQPTKERDNKGKKWPTKHSPYYQPPVAIVDPSFSSSTILFASTVMGLASVVCETKTKIFVRTTQLKKIAY